MTQLFKPKKDSHKGQNGRLLVIGGSKLFHASIFWAAQAASRIVDLVHFSSPAMENNDLVRVKIKEGFWDGIVVGWEKVEEYIEEDDCILIGPGMTRVEDAEIRNSKFEIRNLLDLKEAGEEDRTDLITNYLLRKYPQKRWIVDGGALQECDPKLLNNNMIITPHKKEFKRILSKLSITNFQFSNNDQMTKISKQLNGVTILLKGVRDIICDEKKCETVKGGNEGMTKGGTGDVLAGIVAGLYCKNDAFAAAKTGSEINKRAGDELYKRVGPYFNASDLVGEVARVMKRIIG